MNMASFQESELKCNNNKVIVQIYCAETVELSTPMSQMFIFKPLDLYDH